MANVSVLGLGSMGSALARCLIGNGHDVSVWNRSPEKAEALANTGARVCASADDAVADGDLLVTCIKGHREVLDLIDGLKTPIEGKTLCDMSTGDTEDAERLVSKLTDGGADFMLGMINAYPSDIGKAETAILTVGKSTSWARFGDVFRQLGGKSAHVGETPAALAALFAGLFTVRQGFMFGMIHGALVCQKAGLSLQAFCDQIPASLKLTHDYYDLFARTVPRGEFDSPEASLKVYALALEDALKTYKSLGAPSDFIQIMYDQTKSAWDAGLGEKELTVLASSTE